MGDAVVRIIKACLSCARVKAGFRESGKVGRRPRGEDGADDEAVVAEKPLRWWGTAVGRAVALCGNGVPDVNPEVAGLQSLLHPVWS